MKSILRFSFLVILSAIMFAGCSSKRKRKGQDPSKLSKFYHNTTALYNGYFNANEIMKETYMKLRQQHKDNYTELLPLYDYVSVEDPKSVYAELDKAIEKVTTVASLHEPSRWVDDCYVLMGEAQYLKQEYETSEETFAYFKDEFNPDNPFGRNYKKKKKNKKQIKKEKDKERKEEKKKREDEKDQQREDREINQKTKKKAKKEADKERAKERESKKKEREAEKKKRGKKKKRGGKKSRKKKGKKRRADREDKKIEDKKVEDTKVEEIKEEKQPDVSISEEKKVEKQEREDPRGEETDPREETVDSKKKDDKKKKDKSAYSKGMMWYAKSLVQRDKLSNASYMVKRLKEDGEMSDEARREVPVILADINIKEENYPAAITYLDEAIELGESKSLKARYAFVQGQLYMKAKDYAKASTSFTNAKKWAKSFEMEFMSELNVEKSAMMSGGKSDGSVIAKLDKMTKEAKYSEYLDQLYYTKGEIQLENGSFEDALVSFTKSISNNINNLSLKQETYYKLAYLFYDKEVYVSSKYYFDSTLAVLQKEDIRYREVKNYSQNLTEIANNIELIKMQDSLMGMVAWSDDRIEQEAERLLEESKQAEIAAASSDGDSGRKSTAILNGPRVGLKNSTFFAYDPIAKQRGKKSFKDKWGDIELADNWRRNDKSGIFGADEDEDENEDELVPEDGISEDEITQMINTIKSQIPYGDEAKAGINGKLQKAMYELGKAYREKIQNYEKSVVVHEDLLRRYPEFDQKLDVYYYLYLSYLDLNNSTKSAYYKNKIMSEYPDTEYAKAISNPNYAETQLSEEAKLNKYYQDTYENFEKGNYQVAYTKADQADEIFGKENELRPKFALVKAMATGSLEGKGKYVTALKDVIIRYPNTPEKSRADEILRFLQGDKDAFSGIDIEEVDDIFSAEDGKLHYVAVVLYDTTPDKVVNAKISVSNYNKEFHKLKKLQLGESTLDRKKKSEIVLVRRFENKEKAMDYYKEVTKSGDKFISSELGGYSIYPITQRNYRKMVIEKTDARYRVWFDKNYLGK